MMKTLKRTDLKDFNQLTIFSNIGRTPLKYSRVGLTSKQIDALAAIGIEFIDQVTYTTAYNAGGFKGIGNVAVKKLLILARRNNLK